MRSAQGTRSAGPLLGGACCLSYDTGSGRKHASALALSEEAVAVARSIDAAEPGRADVLYRALNSCQRELYDVGRDAEGLMMRAEMVDIGRAQAELSGVPAGKGLSEWPADCIGTIRWRGREHWPGS